MTFVDRTTKGNFCVRKISQTDDKIEMEVFFDSNKIKRTFIRKDGYWYSKYESVEESGFSVKYGEKYEDE